MWNHPLAARWDSDIVDDGIDPRSHLPEGFDVPSDLRIQESGFSKLVIRESADEYCAQHFENELQDTERS